MKEKIYKAWEQAESKKDKRDYLGISECGHPCDKYVWLAYHVPELKELPGGRVLRMFDRGHREEEVIVNDLKSIGWNLDRVLDNQMTVYACERYLKGHPDGVGRYEEKVYLLEFKTAGDSSFKKLFKSRNILKWNRKYYTQVQIYMRCLGLKYCMFIVVNKNDDDMITIEVDFEDDYAEREIARVKRIVESSEAPEKCENECYFCPFSELCDEETIPNLRTCKNCVNFTADDGQIKCEKGRKPTKACEEHLFIPPLVSSKHEVDENGCVWHYLPNRIPLVDCMQTAFPVVKEIKDIEIMER